LPCNRGQYDNDVSSSPPAGFAPDVVGGSSRNAVLQAKLARKQTENLRREQELKVRGSRLSLSLLSHAKSSLGDAKSSLGDTLRARWVTLRARWVMLRARWVTLRARWVILRARWVTLRARWVTQRARWVGGNPQGVRVNYYEERKRADQLQKEQYSHNAAKVNAHNATAGAGLSGSPGTPLSPIHRCVVAN
jgi:hypothetical protein